MKKINLFLLFLVFTCVTSFGQVIYELRDANEFFRNYKMQTGDHKNILTESDIEGSPYLNNEFIEGSIFTYQKAQFNNIPLRYNIFNDQLEFRTPDKQALELSAPEIVEKAVFGDYILSYIPFKSSKKIKRGFFQILEEGKVTLYSRSEIDYIHPEEAGAYKDPKPARFKKRPDMYYLRIGSEAAVKIENKKMLSGLFPDHNTEVATFIKSEKIKTTKVDNLITLVKYYNSL